MTSFRPARSSLRNALRVALSRLLITAFLVAPTPSSAQEGSDAQDEDLEVIERVVATVGDEAVFLSELRRRAVPFLPQVMAGASEFERQTRLGQLYEQLLDHLVDEILIERAAIDLQVHVSRSDVDRAIENVQRQSRLGDDEFWNAVRAQGFTQAQYREDVRRQLLKLKVLNVRARGRINVDEDAVRQRYSELVRRARASACYMVNDLFFPIEGAASASAVAEARARAEEARDGHTEESFASAATALGRICRGQIRRELEEPLATLEVGEISEPILVDEGFHLLQVSERVAAGDVPSYESVRDDIAREMTEEAMGRVERQYLGELRREAVISKRL